MIHTHAVDRLNPRYLSHTLPEIIEYLVNIVETRSLKKKPPRQLQKDMLRFIRMAQKVRPSTSRGSLNLIVLRMFWEAGLQSGYDWQRIALVKAELEEFRILISMLGIGRKATPTELASAAKFGSILTKFPERRHAPVPQSLLQAT